MIKLYVSEKEPISRDCLYADETKLVSWFEETECELEHEDCQLLLLEDALAEERKRVVQEIWEDFESYFESSNLKWEDKMLVGKVCNMINEILNQVRGE